MDYKEICEILGIEREGDERARDVLDKLVSGFDEKALSSIIKGEKVIVFGCGPSLRADFTRLRPRFDDFVLVSVDGSIRLFMEEGVLPHVHVTDLDGDIPSTIEANKRGTVTIVHAHGDNIKKIGGVVPKLLGKVFGTTQVKSTDKVLNFGGFTDGDRAVYLVEHFKPEVIYLAGMDFGKKIGEYAGTYDPEQKRKKLEIGEKLLEEVKAKTKIPIIHISLFSVFILLGP